MSKTTNRFSPEVRERAARMVDEYRADYVSEWAAMTSIAGKIGCAAETPRRWCREEAGRQAGPVAQTASDKDRLKLLEREVREPRRANEILRKGEPMERQWSERHWRAHILRRRSSTAKANGDVVHRQPP